MHSFQILLSYLYYKEAFLAQRARRPGPAAWAPLAPLAGDQATLWAGFMVKAKSHSDKASFSSFLRYEEEVALRATAENEFVALKKVSG